MRKKTTLTPEHPRTVEQFQRCDICVIVIPEGKVRESRGERFKLQAGRNGVSSLCLRKFIKIHFDSMEKTMET